MTQEPRQSSGRPGSVVMQAYLAANRGRYVEANRHLAPSIIRDASRSATSIRRSRKSIVKILPRVPAPRRLHLRRFLAAIRPFEDPDFCLRSEWRAPTHHPWSASLEEIPATPRGSDARL